MLQKALLTFLSILFFCSSAAATNYREDSFEYFLNPSTYDISFLQKKNIVIIAGEVNIPVQYTGGKSFIYNSSSSYNNSHDVFNPWDGVSGLSSMSDLSSKIETFSGDFNGDGFRDLLLQYSYAERSGKLILVLGSSGDYPSEIIYGFGGGDHGRFSASKWRLSVKDVNSDGKDDIHLVHKGAEITDPLSKDFYLYGASSLDDQYQPLTEGFQQHPNYDVSISKPAHGNVVPGGTTGSFKVDESGAAIFSLPIYSPKGPAGMNMAQALTYSSNSPNGVMGIGWSLSNVDVISVCPTTEFFRGTTSNKGYCFNGSRLIKLNESTNTHIEYMTSISDLTKISAVKLADEPLEFSIKRRDGSYTEFKKITPEMWVADKVWNPTRTAYIHYEFKSLGAGEYDSLPSALEKVSVKKADGTTLSETLYVYEGRDDSITQYFNGDARALNKRLEKVVVSSQGEVVRSYYLSYDRSLLNGRSRLRYIQECGQQNQCFEPLEFDWNTVRASAGVEVVSDIGIADAEASFIGDFNRDGFQDIIIQKDNQLLTKLGAGNGSWNSASTANISLPDDYKNTRRITLFDMDHDGVQEVVVLSGFDDSNSSNSYYRLQVYKSNEASNGSSFNYSLAVQTNIQLYPYSSLELSDPKLADIDGDSKLDVTYWIARKDGANYVYSGIVSSIQGEAYQFHPNFPFSSSSFFFDSAYYSILSHGEYPDSTDVKDLMGLYKLVDVNSDGYLDLVFKGELIRGYNDPHGDPKPVLNKWVVNFSQYGIKRGGLVLDVPVDEDLYFLDVNSDGNLDIHGDIHTNSNFWLNKGSDYLEPKVRFLSYSSNLSYNGKVVQVDLNSDGLSDLIRVYGDGIGGEDSHKQGFLLNLGEQYSRAAAPVFFNNLPSDTRLISIFSTDINQDGVADILRLSSEGKLVSNLIGVNSASSVGQPIDTIQKVTYSNGLSMDVSYSFQKGEDNGPQAVRTAGTRIATVDGPKYVVSKVEEVTASSAIVTRNYQYSGGKYDYDTSGFLGFRHITVSDSATGVNTVTEYAQEYPFVGMPLYTYKYINTPSAVTVSNPNIGLTDLGIQRGGNAYSSVNLSGDDMSSDFNRCRAVVNDAALSGRRLLSCARNILNSKDIAEPTRFENLTPQFVFIETTIEEVFHSPASVTGFGNSNNLLKSIVTSNEYSGTINNFYGEVSKQVVFTNVLLGDKFLSKKLESSYEYQDNNVVNWWLGRMTKQTVSVTQSLIDSGIGSIAGYDTSKVLDSIDMGKNGSERVTEFDYYPGTGLLKSSTTNPSHPNLSINTLYEYDEWGNKIDVTKTSHSGADADLAFWKKSSIEYDANGIYAQKFYEYPSGNESKRLTAQTITRHTMGLPTVSNDANSNQKVNSYDGFGRLTSTSQSNGGSATTSYQFCLSDTHCPTGIGYSVQSTISNNAPSSKIIKDRAGNVIRTSHLGLDGSWVHSDYTYDELGRKLTSSTPHAGNYNTNSVKSSYVYDVFNRMVSTTSVEDKTSTMEYNGLLTKAYDHRGYMRETVQNGLGQQVAVLEYDAGPIRQLLKQTSFKYDVAANQVAAKGDGNIIRTSYNLIGQAISVQDQSKGTWLYKRNALNQVINQQNANGDYVSNQYDNLGRKTQHEVSSNTGNFYTPVLSTPLETTTWEYDQSANGIGKLSSTSGSYLYTGIETNYSYDYVYNNLAQLEKQITTIDGLTYNEHWFYDSVGRLDQYFDASNGSAEIPVNGVKYHYHENYMKALSDAAGDYFYYQTEEVNLFGNVTKAIYGNGVNYQAIYDTGTGRLSFLMSGKSASEDEVLDYFHHYDDIGQLDYVTDGNLGFKEEFEYDNTNRLERVTSTGVFTGNTNNHSDYDLTLTYQVGSSNLKTKSNFEKGTEYQYSESGQCSWACGPNQLTSVGELTFHYDANGNRLRDLRNGVQVRNASYTSYDKPWLIQKGINRTSFAYGPGHSRIKQVAVTEDESKLIHYVGSVEWTQKDGQWKYKRRIAGNVIEEQTDTSVALSYLHKNYQGSVVAITDEQGAVKQRLSYDVYGKRRDVLYDHANGVLKPTTSMYDLIGAYTYNGELQTAVRQAALDSRGYTNHEHLDGVNLIHMNGRVFDPVSAVFMSADPFVQNMNNQYSYNRYSYTYNNPINYTDPSGYFGWGGGTGGGGYGGGNAGTDYYSTHLGGVYDFTSRMSAAIAISVFTGGMASSAGWSWVGAAWAAGGGYASTYVMTGSTGKSEKGALFALATFGAGEYIKGAKWGEYTTIAAQSLTNGTIAGIQANMAGGSFESGFYSAGLSTAAGSQIGRLGNSGYEELAMLSNIVLAGFVSNRTGGSFAMGAATAAFSMGMASFTDSVIAQEEMVSPAAELDTMNAGSLEEEIVGPMPLGDNDLAWPTDHAEITSGYDPNRTHPTTGVVKPHRALDIKNPLGDPLYSVLDGTVAENYQGGVGSAGNYIKINHANGLQSSYAHTGSSLQVGSAVTRGQVIGFSDGSGIGTGPHLHFSLRLNGNRINPCSRLGC